MPKRNPEVYASMYIPSPSGFLNIVSMVEEVLEEAFQGLSRRERVDFDQIKDAYGRLQYLRIKADAARASHHPYPEEVLARLDSIVRKQSRLGHVLDRRGLRLYVRAEEP